MRNRRSFIALLSLAALLAASLAVAGTTTAGGRTLSANLTGAAEVPGPGDADGTGHVSMTVNPGIGEICYTLSVENIQTATAAHIHIGFSDLAGPVVIGLSAPSGGSSSGCVTVSPAKARAIVVSPYAFYVNVHNATFPGGAIRGQLG